MPLPPWAIPAGVGGLNGYAEAFAALRRISGIVPSIMCMFGFNAGGGSYLPRQGSFLIQPNETFFGLTGPGVVKTVLGEDVTPDELGGPGVHSQSGVTDFVVRDEVEALRKAPIDEAISYLYLDATFLDARWARSVENVAALVVIADPDTIDPDRRTGHRISPYCRASVATPS